MYLELRGSGPAVLLLHGQPGFGFNFEKLVSKLVGDHLIILPDRPGYARSFGDPLNFKDSAVELIGRIKSLGIEKIVVLGYSFGAGSAIYFAVLAPELTKALVLVSPLGTKKCLNPLDYLLTKPIVGPVVTFDGMISLDFIMPKLKLLLKESKSKTANNILKRFKLDSIPDIMVTPRPLLKSVGTFVKEQRMLVERIEELENILPQITVPVHIVGGQKDDIITPDSILDLQAKLYDSALTWVKRGTHLLIYEQPKLLSEIVARYSIDP